MDKIKKHRDGKAHVSDRPGRGSLRRVSQPPTQRASNNKKIHPAFILYLAVDGVEEPLVVQPRKVLGDEADHHLPVPLQRCFPQPASLSPPSLTPPAIRAFFVKGKTSPRCKFSYGETASTCLHGSRIILRNVAACTLLRTTTCPACIASSVTSQAPF